MHTRFGAALAEQVIVDLPSDEAETAAMDAALSKHRDVAAVIVEPLLQGAPACACTTTPRWDGSGSYADRHGVLLIFGEISLRGSGRLTP